MPPGLPAGLRPTKPVADPKKIAEIVERVVGEQLDAQVSQLRQAIVARVLEGVKPLLEEKAQAKEEIERLFMLAKETKDPALARRYVHLVRERATRHRISLRSYNRAHCRKCCAYWNSSTLRVRMRPESVVYTCLSCGAIKRFRKR